MTANISAEEEIANLIANSVPEHIFVFKFLPDIQQLISRLTERSKEGTITNDEKEELKRLLLFDNLIGLAKAKAASKIVAK